ncbi:ABC transporter ATP-binding protein [Corynebacterium sp. TAE3-ERU16]|uniref:ABC transporter ATP-binding protein n=1 Tax=Corynebacterium sp. TAE3-ERU16 TaxID=2849493 RepID=UPI001C48E129|nr:ABC transporter ATP-binding protein [Corynebacterium sp. TAE3-ERU16]
MTHRLTTSHLTLGYGAEPIVDRFDSAIEDGVVTGIIGPNGCGKSTLLKGLGRLLTPVSGSALLDGRPIHLIPTREVARTLAILPQSPIAPDEITVRDLVGRGRHPHRGFFSGPTSADRDAVSEALARTRLEDLGDVAVNHLSGGQRQRAWLAMVLAQQPDILLLDEPTSHLDLVHQMQVLRLIRELSATGTTVVVVLHDLALAARFSDRLIAMRDGRLVAQGETHEIFTAGLLESTFGLRARVFIDPDTDLPVVLPLDVTARVLPPNDKPPYPTRKVITKCTSKRI